MRHSKTFFVTTAIVSTISVYSFYSCKKNSEVGNGTGALAALNLPSTPHNYVNQPLPAFLLNPGIAGQDNTPATNRVTDWGATLGRVIFYDKIVSINNTISCASCHQQQFGFSDNKAFSNGFAGGVAGRNSMCLINAKYYPDGKFFWDERANTLEIQTLMPIQNSLEMGMNLDTLISRLKTKAHYTYLFTKAF